MPKIALNGVAGAGKGYAISIVTNTFFPVGPLGVMALNNIMQGKFVPETTQNSFPVVRTPGGVPSVIAQFVAAVVRQKKAPLPVSTSVALAKGEKDNNASKTTIGSLQNSRFMS
jgi:hypothetical protein